MKYLEELLWEWVAVQERAIRMWKGEDALWWYNERVSVCGLAGAVWRSGGIVLEEYSTRRLEPGTITAKRGKLTTVGRGDIWFSLADRRFALEAKQCWPRRGKIKSIKEKLVDAETEAKRCPEDDADVRIAAVFASPSLNRKPGDDDIQISIDKFRMIKCDAWAWVFPHQGRNLYSDGSGRWYPGAAVFLKEACAVE